MDKLYFYIFNNNFQDLTPEKLNEHLNKYDTVNRIMYLFAYSKLIEKLKKDFNFDFENNYKITDEIILLNTNLKYKIEFLDNYCVILISENKCYLAMNYEIDNLNQATNYLSNEEYIKYINTGNKKAYLSGKIAIKNAYSKMLNTKLNERILKQEIIGKAFKYCANNKIIYVSYFSI